jgi:DNA-binding LytR/AlgR family response regulator
MINIAIVEDDKSYIQQLEEYLKRYEAEIGKELNITYFSDGLHIVENYKAEFDIILMDIKMSHMDGMTAAEKVREIDPEVIIIFITETPQYAIQGYTVGALDYILKPISYFAFSQRLEKAIIRITHRATHYITIVFKDGVQKINVENIYYVEIDNHTLTYHTKDGTYYNSGTLKDLEEKLTDVGFFRSHRYFLVNLRYIEGIQENCAIVNGKKLLISRARKAAFLEAFLDYIREV